MRSAYGRTVPAPTIELTHVEAGSPMGELFRRYWQPVCLSDELKNLPKKVKILCEDLVLFRERMARWDALSRTAAIAEPRSSLDAWRITAFAAVITAGFTHPTAR